VGQPTSRSLGHGAVKPVRGASGQIGATAMGGNPLKGRNPMRAAAIAGPNPHRDGVVLRRGEQGPEGERFLAPVRFGGPVARQRQRHEGNGAERRAAPR
jgi:hypothetical protein